MTDADNPLDVCRAELGEPDAAYRLGAGRFWGKLAVGAGLVLAGLAGHYVWWVHGPGRFDHAVLFLGGVVFTGGSLLWQVYRHRGLHVLLYPTGLLRVQGGVVESYPWDEVDEVRLRAESGAVEVERDADGTVTACWLAVAAPTFKLGTAGLFVRRADGAVARLTPALAGYDDLAERVQRATFARLWPYAAGRFRAGLPTQFGAFDASAAGLQTSKGLLPWAEVTKLVVSGKCLTLTRKGRWVAWAAVPLEQVPNPHVLLALAAEARRAAGVDEEETEGE